MSRLFICERLERGAIAPSERDQVIELINLVQPHVPWSSENFEWQYFGGPAGPARLYVARDGGRVISFYAAVLHRLQLRSEVVEGWMVQDVMTHPTYRRQGLLHQLAGLCLDDLRASRGVGYAFPNNLSELSFLRTGWNNWGTIPNWSCSALREERFSAAPRQCDGFDTVATEIWDQTGIIFGVRRDAPYLNWRYAKPGQKYFRFVADGSGVLVLKPYESEKGLRVHVCEVFACASEEPLVAELIRFAMQWASARGAIELTAWMPKQHRYARQLEAGGLRWDGSSTRMVVVTSPPEMDQVVEDRASWYLTHGDSDVY
jgi:hypothetical protein